MRTIVHRIGGRWQFIKRRPALNRKHKQATLLGRGRRWTTIHKWADADSSQVVKRAGSSWIEHIHKQWRKNPKEADG